MAEQSGFERVRRQDQLEPSELDRRARSRGVTGCLRSGHVGALAAASGLYAERPMAPLPHTKSQN